MEHFYHKTQGEDWFTYPNLYKQMVNIAPNNAHFVEVGVWKGRSASFMAVEIINSNKNIRFDLVDHWEGSEEHLDMNEVKEHKIYDIFLSNIEPVKNNVNIVKADSISASELYENESLDFVFIDAAHDYDNVLKDLYAWYPKVKKGGYFAGHDYPSWEGVVRAVNEFIEKEKLQIIVNELSWLIKK